MADQITLTVSDKELAASLDDCEVGETKTVEFKVTEKSGTALSGEVTSVEGYEQEEEENYDAEEEMPRSMKMPKAIVIIGEGK